MEMLQMTFQNFTWSNLLLIHYFTFSKRIYISVMYMTSTLSTNQYEMKDLTRCRVSSLLK